MLHKRGSRWSGLGWQPIALALAGACLLLAVGFDTALNAAGPDKRWPSVQWGFGLGALSAYFIVLYLAARGARRARALSVNWMRRVALMLLAAAAGVTTLLAPMLPFAAVFAICSSATLCPDVANPVGWAWLSLATGLPLWPLWPMVVGISVVALSSMEGAELSDHGSLGRGGNLLALCLMLCLGSQVDAAETQTAASDGQRRPILWDSMYRGLPVTGVNDAVSDIGLDVRLNGFRVGDVVFPVEDCPTSAVACLKTRYLKFLVPPGGCQTTKAWQAFGDSYQCDGEATRFIHRGADVGSLYSIVQTSAEGRVRVFYFNHSAGVLQMTLSGFLYVLQSDRGIGAESGTK